MKRIPFRAFIIATAVALPVAVGGAQTSLRVTVENPIATARADETVGVPWAEVTRMLKGVAANRIRVRDADGRELVSQVVDNDGNGTSDELIFQADFMPGSTRSFTIESGQPTVKAEPRAFVRHDDPRDDMAWESDRIGFRIYGEGLKKTPSAMSSN